MAKKTDLLLILTAMAALCIVAAMGQNSAVPNAPAPKNQAGQPDNSPFKTPKEKQSYALGMNIGDTLHRQSIDIDLAIFQQGIKDAIGGGKTQMSEEEASHVLTQLQAEVRAKAEEKQKQLAATNKTAGDAFLAANKTKEGVVTTPSGLQYKILTPGNGPKPLATDTVSVNYRGTLIDGKEFDSSYKRGQPATFPVNGVIKGWTEVLQLMPVGSKWQVFIPANLAYGEQQRGPDISPNSTLIFDVELLSIKPKDEKTDQKK
ncbi:MAG TPA: FKBP-type peptidyl-prolyl cis-trans isomerase [Terriglobales bacterium]